MPSRSSRPIRAASVGAHDEEPAKELPDGDLVYLVRHGALGMTIEAVGEDHR